jgi:hypothetical protein
MLPNRQILYNAHLAGQSHCKWSIGATKSHLFRRRHPAGLLPVLQPPSRDQILIHRLMIHRLTFLATLIYASFMYHRQRKSTRYALLDRSRTLSTDQSQQNDIIATKHNSQDPKSTYEMYPPPDGTSEALSEPILELITSDTIAELPATRD